MRNPVYMALVSPLKFDFSGETKAIYTGLLIYTTLQRHNFRTVHTVGALTISSIFFGTLVLFTFCQGHIFHVMVMEQKIWIENILKEQTIVDTKKGFYGETKAIYTGLLIYST